MSFPSYTYASVKGSKKRVADTPAEENPKEVDVLDEICSRLNRNDPTLTMINLNHAGIGNRGAIRLSEALRESTSHVVVLFLNDNDVSSKGFQHLADTIAIHHSLKMVYLSYNAIGNIGVSYLANAFRGCAQNTHQRMSRLEVLKLSSNCIGSLGVSELMESLPKSLHTLTLDGNYISDVGMIAIADCLKTNTGLRRLDLRYNNSTIVSPLQCVQSFCTALRSDNLTLRELVFDPDEWDSTCADRNNELRMLNDELQFSLRLNEIGRHSFGTITIPKSLWARVLGKSTCSQGCGGSLRRKTARCTIKQPQDHGRQEHVVIDTELGDPNVTYALLTTRPDLLLPADTAEPPLQEEPCDERAAIIVS